MTDGYNSFIEDKEILRNFEDEFGKREKHLRRILSVREDINKLPDEEKQQHIEKIIDKEKRFHKERFKEKILRKEEYISDDKDKKNNKFTMEEFLKIRNCCFNCKKDISNEEFHIRLKDKKEKFGKENIISYCSDCVNKELSQDNKDKNKNKKAKLN